MMNFISKLREKPESVRRQIAFFTTVGLSLIVVAIWGTSFYLSAGHADDAQVAKNSPFDSLKSTFSSIGEAFSKERAAITESFNFTE